MWNLYSFSRHNKTLLTMIVLSCLLFAVPCPAGGKKRIILLETMPVPNVLEHTRWFVSKLQELGYKQGENLDLVLLKAEGDRNRAITLLKSALALGRPDLVLTNATLASQAAALVLQHTDIPQLFFTVSDPVGAGLIDKIGEPTGKYISKPFSKILLSKAIRDSA